jgi:predicted hydrocarbon binding protein
MYGPRGGRGLALRAGRAAFDNALRNFGALAGVGDLAFKVLPLQTKLRIGIPAMAKIFSQISDQYSTVAEHETEFIYTIHRCPVCWGRNGSDKPVCFVAVGLLQEGLKWVSGGNEFRVNESRCVAMGDPVCDIVIQKHPIS